MRNRTDVGLAEGCTFGSNGYILNPSHEEVIEFSI